MIFIIIITAVVRGEKTRKDFSRLLRQHRAAVIIQKQYKGRISRNIYKDVYDASVLLQSGTKFVSYIVAGPLAVQGYWKDRPLLKSLWSFSDMSETMYPLITLS